MTSLSVEGMWYYGRALSSISEGVTRLARAGRMTCKVRREFKIITDELSRVSLVTSNIRGSSICSPKSLYKKTSNEILAELKAVVKTGALKVPRLRPVLPQSATTYLLWQACQQPALAHTLSPPRGREKKGVTKMNFSSCSDHSWIINDCHIFFPYLRVWEFLFLRTSFFTAQHVGPMVQWTPSHRRAKVGRPTRTYIQQLYADTGFSLEDLPGVMDDRDEWWERIREICANSTTWWWWVLFA